MSENELVREDGTAAEVILSHRSSLFITAERIVITIVHKLVSIKVSRRSSLLGTFKLIKKHASLER